MLNVSVTSIVWHFHDGGMKQGSHQGSKSCRKPTGGMLPVKWTQGHTIGLADGKSDNRQRWVFCQFAGLRIQGLRGEWPEGSCVAWWIRDPRARRGAKGASKSGRWGGWRQCRRRDHSEAVAALRLCSIGEANSRRYMMSATIKVTDRNSKEWMNHAIRAIEK